MYLWVSCHKCSLSMLAGLLCCDSCCSPCFVFQLRSDWHRKRNETDLWYDLPRGGKWFSSYWNSITRQKRVKFHKITLVFPCLAFLAQHGKWRFACLQQPTVGSTRSISFHLQKTGKNYNASIWRSWHAADRFNDRLITNGKMAASVLCPQAVPFSLFSTPLFSIFYFLLSLRPILD